MRNKKHVYSVSSDQKTQITTLVAANAAGSVIPPMHIFPGSRFRYNPLDGCVDGAYFGKSESGWMVTELFYGWVANHFTAHIPPERPVLFLVDGYTSHIDVETSKFCTQNGIPLYCLPPHSSHLTQPLDVDSIKMSTIVNAFARAGIYPVKGDMMKKGGTLHPAKLHHESSDSSQAPMGTYMYV